MQHGRQDPIQDEDQGRLGPLRPRDRTRVILVGELNPYGDVQGTALWPYPPNSSGWRLCHRILGLRASQYVKLFDRVNLCSSAWRPAVARRTVEQIPNFYRILLGQKVCEAHGHSYVPFHLLMTSSFYALVLPHPSGRCRVWNDPAKVDFARECVNHFLTIVVS